MPYLLDTNHCAYILNGLNKQPSKRKPEEVQAIRRFEALLEESTFMSEVTLGEFFFGTNLSPRKAELEERIEIFARAVVPVPVDRSCWLLFGETKAELQRRGTPIQDLDLLIACTARRYDLVLVSNDSAFRNLPESFRVENWADPESVHGE